MSIVVFSFAIFVLFRGHSSLEEASRLVLHDSNFPILFFQRRYWAVLPSFCQALSGDAEQRRDSPQSGPLLCCSVSAATVEEASRLFSWLPRQNRSIPCVCLRREDHAISIFHLPSLPPSANCQRTGAREHHTMSLYHSWMGMQAWERARADASKLRDVSDAGREARPAARGGACAARRKKSQETMK